MKCLHLGQLMEIEPREAATQNSIMRYLKRPFRDRVLYRRVKFRGLTFDEFRHSVDALIERGLVVRETTNYTGRYILRRADAATEATNA
jgi:hypothetical protein